MLIGELSSIDHASRFAKLITSPSNRPPLIPRRGALGVPVVPIFQSQGGLETISPETVASTISRCYGSQENVPVDTFTPTDTIHAFNQRTKDVLLLTNMHRHTFTCRKGARPYRCRLGLKQSTFPFTCVGIITASEPAGNRHRHPLVEDEFHLCVLINPIRKMFKK